MKVDPWAPADGYVPNPLTYAIKKRLQQNRNTMIVSIGDPRSGKSEDEKAQGEEYSLNRPFKAKDITFLPTDYIQALMRGVAGDFVLFDEPGAEWGARNFMSVENKMLNATHITFGSKLVNVGWAVPVLKMQDVVSRMLVRYVLYHRGDGPKGIAAFYRNWVNHYTGKTGRTRLGTIWFARAFQDRPEEAKEYDEMKQQYQDKSYERYYRDFAKSDDDFKDKSEETQANIKKAVELLRADPMRYLNRRGHITGASIKNEFKLTARDADEVARQVNSFLDNNTTGGQS